MQCSATHSSGRVRGCPLNLHEKGCEGEIMGECMSGDRMVGWKFGQLFHLQMYFPESAGFAL